ncbi:hypothetical protein KXX41_006498, partial [Aspergillus fumigatus]
RVRSELDLNECYGISGLDSYDPKVFPEKGGNAFKTKGDLSVVEDARVMYVIYYQPPGSEFGEDLGFSLDTNEVVRNIDGKLSCF